MPPNPLDLKHANRNRVYRYIYAHPGISRPELVQRLAISLPTVMAKVKSLCEAGLVQENGNTESTGGRKAVALYCVDQARIAVGVDITRSHVGLVLADLRGNIVAARRRRAPFAADPAYAQRVGKMAGEMVDAAGIKPDALLGVGVSLPGFLNADGSVFRTTVLPGAWHYETRLLTDAFRLPTVFLNDANAAGYAEMWDAPAGKSFVYLSLSDTVGGAIITNGQLIPGDNQRAGEFGHLTVEYGGKPCYCGQKGCLDAYCSAVPLAEAGGGKLEQFFRGLNQPGSDATVIWQRYVEYLARAVNALRMAFDCEVVVGGFVGGMMEGRLEELRRRVATLGSHEKSGDYVTVCRRKKEASALGAALVHMEEFIRQV